MATTELPSASRMSSPRIHLRILSPRAGRLVRRRPHYSPENAGAGRKIAVSLTLVKHKSREACVIKMDDVRQPVYTCSVCSGFIATRHKAFL